MITRTSVKWKKKIEKLYEIQYVYAIGPFDPAKHNGIPNSFRRIDYRNPLKKNWTDSFISFVGVY